MTLTIEWLNQIQLTIDSNRFYSSHFRGTEEKKNINPRKGDPRIERRQDEVTVLQQLEIRCPPPLLISVVHTRVYTCAGRVISADKTSLFNREAREASSVRLITGNTERGVFSPSLSPRILRAGVFLTPKVLVLDVTREFTRSSRPACRCWSGNTVRVCCMRVQTCS